MSKLKVYGGHTFLKGKQVRVVIATTSWKRAAVLSGESLHHIRGYWSITGNAHELEIALNDPEKMILSERN